MEIVKQNENYINNPLFKLLPIINGISTYIVSPPDENQTFEEYFNSITIQKEKKVATKEENHSEKKEKKQKEKKEEPEEVEEEITDPRILEMGNTIDILMKLTKGTREECFRALQGCSGNIKNAYLYLMDNEKYEKYFFYQSDDYVIKFLKKLYKEENNFQKDNGFKIKNGIYIVGNTLIKENISFNTNEFSLVLSFKITKMKKGEEISVFNLIKKDKTNIIKVLINKDSNLVIANNEDKWNTKILINENKFYLLCIMSNRK